MIVTPVFDTNILIDFLNGNRDAAMELEKYSKRLISIISWMEVMVGCRTEAEKKHVQAWLNHYFSLVPIEAEIAGIAVEIRRKLRLKLPDAIILATAQRHHTLLVTRNSKDFPVDNPTVRIPYQIT